MLKNVRTFAMLSIAKIQAVLMIKRVEYKIAVLLMI